MFILQAFVLLGKFRIYRLSSISLGVLKYLTVKVRLRMTHHEGFATILQA